MVQLSTEKDSTPTLRKATRTTDKHYRPAVRNDKHPSQRQQKSKTAAVIPATP